MTKVEITLPFTMPGYLINLIEENARTYSITINTETRRGKQVLTARFKGRENWNSFLSNVNSRPLHLPPSLFNDVTWPDFGDAKPPTPEEMSRSNHASGKTGPGIKAGPTKAPGREKATERSLPGLERIGPGEGNE